MKQQSCSLIFVLFGILRVLGVFPYKWKHLPGGKLEIKRSVWAIMWSWVLVLALVTLSLSCVVNSPDYQRGVTSTITTHIVNCVTYLISAAFFPYLALRSAKLAHILRRMDETSISLRRRIVGQEDNVQILCVLGITAALLYATYSAYMIFITDPITKTSVLYHMPTIVCDFVTETTAMILGLLLYFILKILSLQSEAAVLKAMDPTTVIPWPAVGDSNSRWAIPRPPVDLVRSDFMECGRRPTETSASDICRASRYILALDDIVLEVVEYAGPPAAMLLLSSSTNVTVMLYLTITKFSSYYIAYIVLKVLSVIQVTFIPDALRCKREKSHRRVRRLLSTHMASVNTKVNLWGVEQVLSACPSFLVCRLFTLDRHVILSVTSSVVTYLVIALQFGFSEIPNTLAANFTVRNLD